MTNFQMNVKLFKHCECMKTNYLFPEKCKTIGWILILFGLVTAILSNEDMLPNLGPTKAISLIPSEKTSFEEGEKVEKHSLSLRRTMIGRMRLQMLPSWWDLSLCRSHD